MLPAMTPGYVTTHSPTRTAEKSRSSRPVEPQWMPASFRPTALCLTGALWTEVAAGAACGTGHLAAQHSSCALLDGSGGLRAGPQLQIHGHVGGCVIACSARPT